MKTVFEWFDFKGTINRDQYFLRGLISLLVFMVLWIIGLIVIQGVFKLELSEFGIAIVQSPLAIICFWFNLSTTAKRCHDIGWHGFMAWGILIPVANLLLGLYLLFKEGDEPPPEQGWK
jgi:uncharacterized membrane protein YhaH (DUF805 family)